MGPAHAQLGRSRRRAIAAVSLAAVVALGLAVHTALPDTSASDIAGDALYAAAAYAAVVLFSPRIRPWAVASIAGGWCVAVELFQLTGIPIALGAAFPPVTLLLGTVFDARDLAVYVAAVVVAGILDTAWGRRAPDMLEE